MKIPHLSKNHQGLTIIELTIVVVVILGLILSLFIGARAFIEGTNRSRCLVNQRDIHMAGRCYQNLNGYQIGQAYDPKDVVGATGLLLSQTGCPSDGEYEWSDRIPDFSNLFVTCTLATSDQHHPEDVVGW